MTIFYDHLTGLDTVRRELEQHLSPAELDEVVGLLDTALHHVVMEVVLRELPFEEHDTFLQRFAADPTLPGHLDYLRQFSPHIEERIALAASASNRRFLDTIHE